jgi:hypothetical protein
MGGLGVITTKHECFKHTSAWLTISVRGQQVSAGMIELHMRDIVNPVLSARNILVPQRHSP